MSRTLRGVFFLAAIATASPALAEPGGCLKYGAAGAVGGHFVKHGVLGAVGGCVAGMYTRHEYRKGIAEKAALWDKEHPAAPDEKASWWQRHHDAASVKQKAEWYDAEHPSNGAPQNNATPN
ncbi:hypothetical protein AA106555_1502 [Neokomagataea thailandica NBRC 106555]|uniref:Uncharacterized protein n=2 Tax=Neokomagataea TaxID=1223423 RepID=A0A4Y6V701_9PROT|nr:MULTISPECIES: hypothetical protein [Neokomagataea]QDH25849.1 hypothetical protein D5366_04745 [Neokomagataea tanensis]GBR53953.1 hypothetical protein AA106555_1502 [Neokomagataea thailandica NBRC 106555]